MSNVATAEHEQDPDEFPRPFGQYLLLENFARGGMGEVYLAKIGGIAGLERYCVLKKLRSELTRDREYVTRFIDEARVVVTLGHANICHVFDVGRVGDEYYLAMEYISGRDVRTIQDRVRTRERVIPPATALHVVCETLEALDYAHRRNHPLTGEPLNLVHRDVSPQNVLVSYEGEVKLIDFGLAASKLKVERTQPNVVMGKMAYMAPEQARGDPIDARADLFACGVLAYELMSGERFYEGMTANDIWQVAGKGGFVPRKWKDIDSDVAKHLAKALHPDPKKRFASCGDFRDSLMSFIHWKFPGTGVRGLREVLADLFAEELRREREMLARFGKVTVAGFRTEFEETKSQSVSLARADDSSGAPARAQIVRNEQTSSTPMGPMPSPDTSANAPSGPRGKSSNSGARDVHQDPTRLGSLPLDTKEDGDTDVAPRAKRKEKDTTDEQEPQREMTMRVTRFRGQGGSASGSGGARVMSASSALDDSTKAAMQQITGGRRLKIMVGAAAIAALAAAAVVVVINTGEAAAVPAPDEAARPRVAVLPAPSLAAPAVAASAAPREVPAVSAAPVASAVVVESVKEEPVAASATPRSAAIPESKKPKRGTGGAAARVKGADTGPTDATPPPPPPSTAPIEKIEKPPKEVKKVAASSAASTPPAPAALSKEQALKIGEKCKPCAQMAVVARMMTGDQELKRLTMCIEKNSCK